ncbi:hypothetical protein BZA77DRAFT_316433 [Pyronema omphalodes]|nr:hypothetical protein BZA77DRAFT_316433 [Pyronema omphalodes]
MLNSSSKITQEYSQIPSTEETEPPRPQQRSHFPLFPSLFCILLGISIGITLGFTLKPSLKHASSLVPLEILRNRKPVAFFPDPRYVGGTEEVHQNWKNLVKAGDAVYLPNAPKLGLDKGIKAPPQVPQPNDSKMLVPDFYVISNLHQLHCLSVIRKRYWHIISGKYSPSDADAEAWQEHIDHCVEYLRLGITCGDLLVVEPDSPEGTSEEFTKGNLGWGAVHQCMDWERLIGWQREQERVWNGTWQQGL